MRERPWLSALGLRGQIAGAVLVTAVATLAVAAVVLLGPLESGLQNAAKTTLQKELGSSPYAPLRRHGFDPAMVVYAYASDQQSQRRGRQVLDAVQDDLARLQNNSSANEVDLLSAADPSQPLVAWPLQRVPPISAADSYRVVTAALHHPHRGGVYGVGTINGTQYAEAAIPFTTPATATTPAGRWVLAVRKNIDEIPGAVRAVRTAFLIAALVALALTLLIGIPLSGRIVRRLRRLRQAARRLAEGGPSVTVPVDRALDEVGDLARTFALMQRQLLHQEHARRAFVATASHELRTPLATLDGMLELLDEDLSSGDPDLADAQDLIDRARAQSKRLGRLAADLLDLSRLDAEIELRSEPVELGELSRAVLAEFELGTAERDILTLLDDQSGPVWARGDPGSVARILRILVDNAVKLSPHGGQVKVQLRNGEAASLTVCDQGPGVLPEERELIFERFTRGRQMANQGGFGLGLAIGRELAERMGGALVLEEEDGFGARFTLRLPVAHAPDIEPLVVG